MNENSLVRPCSSLCLYFQILKSNREQAKRALKENFVLMAEQFPEYQFSDASLEAQFSELEQSFLAIFPEAANQNLTEFDVFTHHYEFIRPFLNPATGEMNQADKIEELMEMTGFDIDAV